MKLLKTWSTIVEVMVSLLIITVGIIWVYTIYSKSANLSTSTKNRVKALSIAREWIESIENIRDSNWIAFSADTRNCWNTFNYDITCIQNTTTSWKISSWSYTIYRDSTNRWLLKQETTTWSYNQESYRNTYKVNMDDNWFYTQSWWTSFFPIFTRQIIISYPYWPNYDATDEKMKIESLVYWSDNSKNWFSKIELDNMLTNWKKD